MSGWWSLGITCPRCEVPLEPRAIGRPTDHGCRTISSGQCPDCRREFAVTVELRTLGGRPAVPL